MSKINPCVCQRPAVILDGRVPGTFEIGCWGIDCEKAPIVYTEGNKRSRAAAIRAWNKRYERAVSNE